MQDAPAPAMYTRVACVGDDSAEFSALHDTKKVVAVRGMHCCQMPAQIHNLTLPYLVNPALLRRSDALRQQRLRALQLSALQPLPVLWLCKACAAAKCSTERCQGHYK